MTDNGRASTGDRRVRRTRASLQRALIELVAEQDLSEIGVADVVDRADVSRSTFYDHYRDVHELAEAACASMIDDLLASLTTVDPAPAKPSDPREDPNPAVTAFFRHFAEHAALYRSLLGPTGSARVIEHVRRRTTAAARLYPLLPATDDIPERARPTHRTCRATFPQRSSRAPSSALPPTGYSAERFHHDADVVHPLKRHAAILAVRKDHQCPRGARIRCPYLWLRQRAGMKLL